MRTCKIALASLIASLVAGLQASSLDQLDGVKTPDVSLDGTWHFQLPAPNDFWKEEGALTGWKTMPVPGDVFRD